MTGNNRSTDRKDLDAMTRDFLDKGGQIVQCPPGSSETVVYKKNSFRRRAAPANAQGAAGETQAAPAPTGGEEKPAGSTDG